MQGLFMEVDDNDDDDANLADKKLDALLLTSTHVTDFGVALGFQELDGRSILEHSLSQLLLAGIDRVVLAVAASSDTQRHVEQSALFSRMHIVFLEVVPSVLDSIPETVLAARHLFAGHFLIHAADRVFDMALLKKFDAFHRTHHRVSVLVESDLAVAARMPPSTVTRIAMATDPYNILELSFGVVPVGNCVLPGDISLEGSAGDEYVLAIPTAPTPSSTLPRTSSTASSPLLRRLSPRKSAFLVPQHESDGHTRSFLLAVPVDRTNEPLIHPPTLRSTLRRLSALPSDVKDVTLEASMVGGMMAMQLTVTKQVPWVGFVILAGALLSVSAQGAALQMLAAVPPLVKMVWRYFGSSVLFGCLTWWLDGGLPPPPSGSWVIVGRETLLCSAAYVVFSATFIWALDHTSVGHAYIFTNSHSILLVVGKCMFGHPVAGLEAAGAFLGIAGGVITSADHESTNTATNGASQHPPTLEGDIVAFVGAIGGVAYLIYAKRLQELLGVRLFCFCLFTTTWMLLLPLLWIMQEDLTWSSDPVVGFYGWTHHLGIEGVLVVVVSACGTMGFITSMKYFPPLVVSVTMLLEPIVATIICIIVGTATTPGWVTFVGGSVVVAGTLLVICSTSNTAEVTNISEAMVVQSHDNGSTPKGYGACS
ncbi:hypothetical protein B5M09_001735 [Aphanomyces astaci]|uniref:EamA domain-containing protein n=1 Tax=Aphanomyces astaci TaxID=112090 RepID=A0A3R7WJR0_APHAT|nr:hypothetical protein B5M09_001735 [Aphanomyces astaci]